MEMFNSPHALEDYLAKELICACGQTHYVPIKAVEIGAGVLEKLPDYVVKFGYNRPFIICDAITYEIAGARCESSLHVGAIHPECYILTHLGFDEATLGEIVVNIPVDCDLIIGVGTGSITDITRYSSYKLHLPCFTVATGAPMDGFAASIGIMNVNNLKATMPAHNSEVIIGDTDILKSAPYRMTVAGFGDLIGKITCLNDWELARIIIDEHYCPNIVALVKECLDNVIRESDKIRERDPEVLGNIMRGLVLSGVAISLNADSRPASGAEHHVSHYWETVLEQRGQSHSMHGEQVAVGTVLVLMLAQELVKSKPDFAKARIVAAEFDRVEWEREIRRCYGSAADEVIQMENEAGKNEVKGRLARIERMEAHWGEIVSQLRTLPTAEYLLELLRKIGCPCLPTEIGIDYSTLKDTLMYCKEIRKRYTIFQTVYDLGIMDNLSDNIINHIKATDCTQS